MPKSKNRNTSSKILSFEKNLEEINKVVDELEDGGLSLNDSLEKFRKGTSLINQCSKELEVAELEIETIIKKKNG